MKAKRPTAVVTSTIPLTLHKFHRELIRELTVGYEVHVISSPGTTLDLIAQELPVRIHALEMGRRITLAADLRALYAWWRLLRRLRADLIITATPKASFLAQLAARSAGVPQRLYYVGGLRLEGAKGLQRKILTVMERETSRAATVIVANSASLARRQQELRLAPAAKIHRTQPGSSHGVDSVHFAPMERAAALGVSLGLDASVPVVGFVGRLTHDKGVDVLIEAAQTLFRQGLDFQLLIVGPQDEPDSLRFLHKLRAAGVRAVAVGAVDDVRPYMSLMTLHTLPSLREGFPNVVLEASAMAIPTITTDATGAIDSVIPGETGIIVPAGCSDALALAINRLLTNPEERERLGARARAWVVRDFRPNDVVRSLLAPVAE